MIPKTLTVTFSRKVSTGPYENADILLSETYDLAPSEDPESAGRKVFARLRAAVDDWAEDIRG